jgi:predicted amidohydrolase
MVRGRSLLPVVLGFLLTLPAAGANLAARKTSDQPPRKVIAGTVMQSLWVKYPGLRVRWDQLTAIVDRMQAQSERRYGGGLDLAIRPEMPVTGEGERIGEVADWSIPLEGALQESLAREARQCHCYIAAPSYLLENQAAKQCPNAAILFDRNGNVAGIYRKVHLVADVSSGSMEHSSTPGKEEQVFDCDFDKLGIQICYDIELDDG